MYKYAASMLWLVVNVSAQEDVLESFEIKCYELSNL